jgi:hypothetical protein
VGRFSKEGSMARKPKVKPAEPLALNPKSFIGFYGKLLPLNAEARDAREEAKSRTGAYRAARKLGKDQLGVNLRALAFVEELKTMERDEALLLLRDVSRYARWLQLPFGMQLDMFGHNDDAQPDQDDMDEAVRVLQLETGQLRGLAGDTADDNPHDAGSIAYVAWEEGRTEGAESKATMEGRGATVTASPRGRRRSSRNPEDRADA